MHKRHSHLPLQWGRDQMIAEMLVFHLQPACNLHASMGPRSNDRGNPAPVPEPVPAPEGFNGAAIKWSRKCATPKVVTIQQHSASMGPRSNDRGNPPVGALPLERPRLQWGRDQMIAEMQRGNGLTPVLLELQWGRDQMIAEIREGQAARTFRLQASMGPRSNDRGNEEFFEQRRGRHVASMGPRSNDRGNGGAVTVLIDKR